MQRELGLLANSTPPVRRADPNLVRQCKNEQDAYKLCLSLSPVYRTQGDIADILGISRTQFNKALNADSRGRRQSLMITAIVDLQRLCCNTAVRQWEDMYAEGLLDCQRKPEDREAELLAELAELRASA